jgi:Concanavalin A-like lectin/glucanases superfamily
MNPDCQHIYFALAMSLFNRGIRMVRGCSSWCLFSIAIVTSFSCFGDEPELLARWALGAKEGIGTTKGPLVSTQSSKPIDVQPTKEGTDSRAAFAFNGRTSFVELPDASKIQLDSDPFSITMWVDTADLGHDPIGDLLSQYDPATRTGFHLGIYTHAGVTNGQANLRQLHFGIDQGRIERNFTDHGRLGNAVYIFAMCVHDGRLYASTCEAQQDQAGHVFRFEGGDRWTDLGSPDKANAVSAMATFDGQLYVASSKYRLGGSSLAESTNENFGGKIFRLNQSDNWEYCGTLSAATEAVSSLIDFRGKLYAGSLYRPAGFFRFDGGQQWTPLETPDGKRVEAMTVFNDALYATCYDEGAVFRYDGRRWESLGIVPGATQTYGFGIYQGQLFVSEWPQAHVFRWNELDRNWVDSGKLGTELEAMPLMVYNGKMYCGSLPSAEIFRFDSPMAWTKIGCVDSTPDVRYRRAWSMAVYQGRMFVGTLPSGRVMSIEAGRNVTFDRSFPTGSHHIAAVRGKDRLQLHVDGEVVAESTLFNSTDFNLNNTQPIKIGAGAQDCFHGAITDVRIYRGALTADQIRSLFGRGVER